MQAEIAKFNEIRLILCYIYFNNNHESSTIYYPGEFSLLAGVGQSFPLKVLYFGRVFMAACPCWRQPQLLAVGLAFA